MRENVIRVKVFPTSMQPCDILLGNYSNTAAPDALTVCMTDVKVDRIIFQTRAS